MEENFEKLLETLNCQAEMLRTTLQDEKLSDTAKTMIEYLLDYTEESIGKLSEENEGLEVANEKVVKVKFADIHGITDLSKLIKDNSDTILKEDVDKKSFIEGAKWLYTEIELEFKSVTEKLRKYKDYINKLNSQINEYRELFEPKSYTATKKTKHKKTESEDDSDVYEGNDTSDSGENYDYE